MSALRTFMLNAGSSGHFANLITDQVDKLRAFRNLSTMKFVPSIAVSLLAYPGWLAAGDVLRGPYLQQAGSDRMTIRWRGGNAPGAVRYGTDPLQLPARAVWENSVPSPPFDHVLTLTGLTPGTTYYYNIGIGFQLPPDSPDYTFATPPPPGTAVPTRIWVMGDAGTGDANQAAVRDAFRAWRGSRNADFVLQLGDNAYFRGEDTEYQTAMFEVYAPELCEMPFWSCIGNHETYTSLPPGGQYPYFDIYSQPTGGECGGVASATENYYSFDYGNIHVICLDSKASDRSTTGAMATWLQTDLANTPATWIICCFHHPPYTKGSHDSDTEIELIQMRESILPLLEAGGVDLVLCGHSHSYERSYLLDGHYGHSESLVPAMQKNSGNGQPAGGSAYSKPLTGPRDHFGTIYCVTGCAGKVSGGALNHPAHVVSLNVLGSLALDINGPRLDATFVGADHVVHDSFTITKQGAADSDQDRIPDTYEILHGLNRLDAADALLDSDGDGSNNLEEYAFGRPASTPDGYAFTVSPDPANGNVTIRFPTVVNRTYQIFRSGSLLASDWHPCSPSIIGTGSSAFWLDDGLSAPVPAGTHRFYRIQATAPP